MGKTVVTIRPRRKPKPPEYPDHQSMSADEITSFIEAHTWKFAKTMPFSPHSYVVKENCRDPREFERFVLTIRRHGYRTRYGKSYYTVLDHPTEDGTVSKFWTMGAPLNRTIIINRALKPGSPPSVFITALRSAADIIAAKAEAEGKHDQAQEIRLAVTAASVGDWSYVQRLQIELPRFELPQFKPLRVRAIRAAHILTDIRFRAFVMDLRRSCHGPSSQPAWQKWTPRGAPLNPRRRRSSRPAI